MFAHCFNSVSRLFSRPILRDFSLPRPHAPNSRRFFREPPRKPSRVRLPLAIAISVYTISAVDRFGPQGLIDVWRTPLQTAKSHLENLRSAKLDEDPDEKLELPSPWRPDPNRRLSVAEEEEVIRDRLAIRTIFKHARASSSEEEMRRACFAVVSFLSGISDVVDSGPLAPLPTDSQFAGNNTLFDMTKDTGVYRILEPDGMTSMVFVAVNAELEFEPVPEDSKNAMHQVCEGFVNQFDIWERERSVRFNAYPWCRLFSLYGNMLYSPSMHRFLRTLTGMEDFR